MNILKSLPGPLLIFFGALSLSFGGLIVKSFEGATLWQILFWRSLFFSLTVLTFLIITYKSKVLKSFHDSGLPGFIGGLIVKSFEGATLWQILFWRSLFFSLTVLTFLIITYKSKVLKSFHDSGLPGFILSLIHI